MKHPRVEVHWIDACTYTNTYEVPEAIEVCQLARRTIYGLLIHRDETRVLVAGTTDKDGEVGDVTAIPAGWVTEIINLGPKTVRKKKEKEKEVLPA